MEGLGKFKRKHANIIIIMNTLRENTSVLLKTTTTKINQWLPVPFICPKYPNCLHRVGTNDTGFTRNPYSSGATAEDKVRYLSTHNTEYLELGYWIPVPVSTMHGNVSSKPHMPMSQWRFHSMTLTMFIYRLIKHKGVFSALQHKVHGNSVGTLSRVEGTLMSPALQLMWRRHMTWHMLQCMWFCRSLAVSKAQHLRLKNMIQDI